MITISSAENALKNIYLESVINDINTKTNPFLTMVQRNAKAVNGKEARANIRYANGGSVASGAEGGDLPINQNGKNAEIVSQLKNLYGTFQISDKAMRAASGSASAFAGLLAQEMQNLISTAQSSLNGMIYGNGKKLLGYTESVTILTNRFIVPARFLPNLKVGDAIILASANNETLVAGTIDTITASTREIKIAATQAWMNGTQDRYYIYSATADETELSGIDTIFRQDKIYNLDRASHAEIAPCIMARAATGGSAATLEVLDEAEIMKFFDMYEEHCQGIPADLLLTHPIVRKAVFENLKSNRTNIDVAELAGGFRGFSFNGIPVYSDIKCKGGTMYALNSDSWAMHQLCDWTWLSGEDGGILKQIDGKAGYSATLVKYADLLCDKPFIQGKVTNYSAVRAV